MTHTEAEAKAEAEESQVGYYKLFLGVYIFENWPWREKWKINHRKESLSPFLILITKNINYFPIKIIVFPDLARVKNSKIYTPDFWLTADLVSKDAPSKELCLI